MNRRTFLKSSGIVCGLSLMSPLSFAQKQQNLFTNKKEYKYSVKG